MRRAQHVFAVLITIVLAAGVSLAAATHTGRAPSGEARKLHLLAAGHRYAESDPVGSRQRARLHQ